MSTVIHIGMQKTGTTFLQQAFDESRAKLQERGLIYPEAAAGLGISCHATAHHWLAHAIIGERKPYTPKADFERMDEHLSALIRLRQAAPESLVLVSSEDFSSMDESGIRKLRELFPADVRIIVYLRRQDEWLDSFYAQMVKVGRNISPAELLARNKWRLDYASWLDLWASHFGKENLIVRTYEEFGPKNTIWDDFLTAIGRADLADIRPSFTASNQSLCYELTLFSKAQHIHGENRKLRHLLDEINDGFSKREGLKYIDVPFARSILEQFEASNQRVAQSYFARDRLFKNHTPRVADTSNTTLSIEQLSQIVGGISLRLLDRVTDLEKQLKQVKQARKRDREPALHQPLLYATRSILPSHTANSVQSSAMACSFDKQVSAFTAVYRTAEPSAAPESHFAPYGLTPPRHTHVLHAPSRWLDWAHTDLPGFRNFLRYQPRNTLVYTRSSRLSWASASSGLPTIIELHDPLTRVRVAWIRHLLETRRLPAIVTTTVRLKNDILAAFPLLDSSRILVAGGAASGGLVDLPPLQLKEAREFNVGYAGSAFPGKGLEVILACAERMPKVGFHVIGPRPEDCADRGAISPNVIFYGYKPHPEAVGLLKSMDALLLPNQRSVIIRSGADIGAHTSPLKLFEYLSTKRPIIASDLPIFKDVLTAGENALMAPPEDIEAFCNQLNRLQSEPALGRALGAQAQRDFIAHHTWDHRARRIINFMARQAPLAA